MKKVYSISHSAGIDTICGVTLIDALQKYFRQTGIDIFALDSGIV